MEVKSKMRAVSFAVTIVFFAVSLALFFLAPILSEGVAGIYPDGLSSLLTGFKNIFSFNFESGKYLVFAIFTLLFLVCFIWWLIVIIIRRKWRSLIFFFVNLLLTAAAGAVAAFYFIVEGDSVLKQVFALNGEVIGKAFVAGSVAFAVFGVMFGTLCAYTDLLVSMESRANEMSAEEEQIREIVKDEIEKDKADKLDNMMEELEMSDKLDLHRSNDDYYESLINELGMFKGKKTTKVVVEEVKPAPVAKPAPAPVAPAPAPVAPAEKAEPVERIPFAVRITKGSAELRAHYNELKNEILSYGIKSRVSNSADTFRLHTKTYVKLVVAGKGLKLFFALNPKDYKDSTMPIIDASKKASYAEIPLGFKVKSELSVRRAKQLIADAAAKDGLVQGEVGKDNWAKELK